MDKFDIKYIFFGKSIPIFMLTNNLSMGKMD